MKIKNVKTYYVNKWLENEVLKIILHGSVISLIGKIFGRGIQLTINMFIARYYGPKIYGTFAIGYILFRIFQQIMTIGFDRAIIYFGMDYYENKKWKIYELLNLFNKITGVLGVTIILILLVITLMISDSSEKKEVMVVASIMFLSLPFSVMLRTNSSATQITQKMQHSIVLEELMQPALNIALLWVLYSLGLSFNKLLAAFFISYLVTYVYSNKIIKQLFYKRRKPTRKISIKSITPMIRYSFPITLTSIVTLLMTWTGEIILSYWGSLYDVGVYHASVQIISIVILLNSGILMIMSPVSAKFKDQKNSDKLTEAFGLSVESSMVVIFPILAVLIIMPVEVLKILFGEAYSKINVVLTILVIGQLVRVSTGGVNHVMVMTGKHATWARVSSLTFILTVILGILLFKNFGLSGLALSSAISISVLHIAGLIYISKLINFIDYLSKLIFGSISLSITIYTVSKLKIYYFDNSIYSLVLTLFLSYLIFLTLYLFKIIMSSRKKIKLGIVKLS